jgi:lipoprotein-anchoring transpeptidase ErfK/SrfK
MLPWRRSCWCTVLGLAALCWACVVAPAHALTISAPADTTGSVDVAVVFGPADTTGTVTLLVDGRAVATRPDVSAGMVFDTVTLATGPHSLRAELSPDVGIPIVSRTAAVYSWGVPGAPRWVNPLQGVVVTPLEVKVYAGSSTASMTLRVAGRVVRTVRCAPGVLVTFGKVALLSPGAQAFVLTVESRYGVVATYRRSARRVEYPYATMIIIDKSDYRLYWIRNRQLVKAYPIAHGRNNVTPLATWKILAKYRTDAGGVYGPRKMRLFRQVGRPGRYHYVFTAYGVHGTNQPWVIGTQASHGCIRMYNRDILQLWPQVPVGTMVITRA